MSEAFLAAIVSRLTSSWAAGRVYPLRAVPGEAVTPYLAVSLSSPAPEHASGDGSSRARRYRVAVQAIGRTSNECLRAAEKVYTAFDGHSLTVAGFDVTPPDPEQWVSSNPSDDNDAEGGGLLSATVTFPLYAYPEES